MNFFDKKIWFLGHIVTSNGISMDSKKLRAIKNFPAPRNHKEMQSFKGFWNFHCTFVDHSLTLWKRGLLGVLARTKRKCLKISKNCSPNDIYLISVSIEICICRRTPANLGLMLSFFSSFSKESVTPYILLIGH